jgi:hypothetical protein
VQVLERDREVLRGLGEVVGALAQLGDRRARGQDGAAADLGGVAERADRGARGLRVRPERLEEPLEERRGAVEVRQRRDLGVGGVLEVGQRRLELLEEARQQAPLLADAVLLGRRRRGGVARLLDEAGDLVALAATRAKTRSASRYSVEMTLRWSRRIASRRSTCRSAGTARRIVSLRSSPRRRGRRRAG